MNNLKFDLYCLIGSMKNTIQLPSALLPGQGYTLKVETVGWADGGGWRGGRGGRGRGGGGWRGGGGGRGGRGGQRGHGGVSKPGKLHLQLMF